MPEQWPRVHVRAALREVGYDAIGAETVAAALGYPPADKSRGPVRAIILDDAAAVAVPPDAVDLLLSRHGHPAVLLITSAVKEPPEVGGAHRMTRPTSIGEIVRAVRDLVPLAPEAQGPLDPDG
ncbi:MAG TPA: hypothetical protein VEI06_01690 [Gemmatimonadaceae bacterium]|nr:hypothetical protein [Gemmatimonadaceae bacterium]